jgi:hypothetical protein
MSDLEDKILACFALFCALALIAMVLAFPIMLVVDGPWAFVAVPPIMIVLFGIWWKRAYVPHMEQKRKDEERDRRSSHEAWKIRAKKARAEAARRNQAGTEFWDDYKPL